MGWRHFAIAVFALVALPGQAVCECDPAKAPPALPGGADAWLAASSAGISSALREKRLAFPKSRELEGLCPGMTPAVVLFAHPPEQVFELLIQTERQAEVMRFIDAIEPVSRRPEDHVDRHELKILFTRIRYHVRHHWDGEAMRIWWDLAPSHANDIREITGYWELYPLSGNRSLGLYASAVDVGPVIPRRMQAALTRKNLRSAVESFRRWVDEEGGRSR